MSLNGYTVEVSIFSPCATERDMYDFFFFSGAIEHNEIIRLHRGTNSGQLQGKQQLWLRVKAMLFKGCTLGKDALAKAKAFDESQHVTAMSAAKVAELSRGVGLTDKICAGVDAVRSADQQYHVSETTKVVASATARTAASVANTVVNSSYFSAGAMWVCAEQAWQPWQQALEARGHFVNK